MRNGQERSNVAGWIILLTFALAAWITVKCWVHMRGRSPSWLRPTLAIVLSWLAIYVYFRVHIKKA